VEKIKTPNKAKSGNFDNSYTINAQNAPDQNFHSNPGRNNSSMMDMNMMPNLDFTSDDTGESIRVCIRVRPLNVTELGRGDSKCVEFLDNSTLLFKNK